MMWIGVVKSQVGRFMCDAGTVEGVVGVIFDTRGKSDWVIWVEVGEDGNEEFEGGDLDYNSRCLCLASQCGWLQDGIAVGLSSR